MRAYLNTFGNPWNTIDALMNGIFSNPGYREETEKYPRVNVWENESGLIFEAEVPGCLPEQIDIGIEGNALHIKGVRSHADQQETFHRTFHLPFELDGENIKATLKNGLLTIEAPRKTTAKRKIAIQTL